MRSAASCSARMPLASARAHPVLQVRQHLLARRRRLVPGRQQLGAHLDQRLHRAALRHQFGQRALLLRRQLRDVALAQPALQAGEARTVVRVHLLQFVAQRLLQRARVLGEHVVAVGDQRLQRLGVDRALGLGHRRPGRHAQHLGQAERLEHADVDPADVELVPLVRQLGRRRIGVVVVVQLLAADPDAPRRDVGAGVRRVVVAVAPEVADAVDDAGGVERESRSSGSPRRPGRPRRTAPGSRPSIRPQPCHTKREKTLRSIQSSGVPWP